MFRDLVILFILPVLALGAVSGETRAQRRSVFSHADSLRGSLTPERRCYDVRFYHLDVTVDPVRRFISGSNTIVFTADSASGRYQVDLFANMQVDSIVLDDNPSRLKYTRDSNAIFIVTPEPLSTGSSHALRIAYSGFPVAAKNPPWDGGFVWKTDSAGAPWVSVTCQGTGASLWWPNKDHQSDKPDSMLISITVPDSLMDISNGRLRGIERVRPGWNRFDWFVSAPINNYNVTCNIGKFGHFSDAYLSNGRDTLTLDYYVLPRHLQQARKQFAQVRPMMKAFEEFFGPYPFVRDGYKLIESSHTGMEHQSAVAYGNRFLGGYRGHSSSEVGLKFDFIIIHESAHEWWGNSVTSADIADMWIHESFGAYAEALFVEHEYGREASLTYINAKKQNVRNDSPIAGVYDVQDEGSGDMYDKGQLILNTLRSVVNDDSLWFSILRGMQSEFRYRSISYDDVVRYFNTRTRKDFEPVFGQYIRHTRPPRLDCVLVKKGPKLTLRYRWDADVPSFRMPVKVTLSKGNFGFIEPTAQWQQMTLSDLRPDDFQVAEMYFYCAVKLMRIYEDPGLPDDR